MRILYIYRIHQDIIINQRSGVVIITEPRRNARISHTTPSHSPKTPQVLPNRVPRSHPQPQKTTRTSTPSLKPQVPRKLTQNGIGTLQPKKATADLARRYSRPHHHTRKPLAREHLPNFPILVSRETSAGNVISS